jgi:hypothetical protein
MKVGEERIPNYQYLALSVFQLIESGKGYDGEGMILCIGESGGIDSYVWITVQ